MERLLSVILAGGRGKRMGILCHERPKPALPFGGQYRVVDFCLSNCINSGISNIAVLVDYQRSYMDNYLRRWSSNNYGLNNFQILEPKTANYETTADAVYQNLDYLEQQKADLVLIMPSDHVYEMDYRQMVALHREKRAELTIAVISAPTKEVSRFGNIIADGNGRIKEYIEKPSEPQSNLVSMGIFLFNKKILTESLIEDANQMGGAHGFERAIIPKLLRQKVSVFAHKFTGHWQDIGTKIAYFKANVELTGSKSLLKSKSAWRVLTERHNLPPYLVLGQGKVDNSLISPGCIVKGHVQNSILSPGVYVQEQAVVKNSVVMENVSIGFHSILNHCVIDQDAKIGNYSYIGFGGSGNISSEDITVVGKGVTIPSHTAVGSNCEILEHVGPSDFSTNVLPAGSTLSRRLAVETEAV